MFGDKQDPADLFLDAHNYDNWFENQESDDTTSEKSDKEQSAHLSDMTTVEGNEEEVREGKGLEIKTQKNY